MLSRLNKTFTDSRKFLHEIFDFSLNLYLIVIIKTSTKQESNLNWIKYVCAE